MTTQWQYLESRPHPWRKQLYVKGRRLKAFDVWMDMIVNDETELDASLNWDLPLAAIREIVDYCSTQVELLKQEADLERQSLESQGYSVESQITR